MFSKQLIPTKNLKQQMMKNTIKPTLEELEQIEKEKLMTRDNFVLAYLLPMNPNICHRDDAIKIIEKYLRYFMGEF